MAPIPISASSTLAESPRSRLNKEDFPNVKFWNKETWFKWRRDTDIARSEARSRNGRPAKGENTTMVYVEDENGQTIDGHRASEIRASAYLMFQRFKEEGVAPTTWGKASVATANTFEREMEDAFEELRYCDDNWKARMVATLTYPKWATTHLRNRSSSQSSVGEIAWNLKRTSEDFGEVPLKKLRVVDQGMPAQMVSYLIIFSQIGRAHV